MEIMMHAQTAPLSAELIRAKRISYAFLVLMVLGSIGLDQVSKVQAHRQLMVWTHEADPDLYQGRRLPLWSIGDPMSMQTGVGQYVSFNLNYVRNQGAAWGALSDLKDNFRVPFFYGVTIIAVTIIFAYLRMTPLNHRLARLALTMVLGGAIGNFIDRIRLGYVIDFIDVNWNLFGWRYFFPNFNVADSCITVGVVFLLFDMLVLEHIRKRRALA